MKRALGTALLLLLLAPPAMGQRGGVFVDPNSPAGVEYAIPLEQARREAAGDASVNPGGRPSGGQAAAQTEGQQLFGEGIEPVGGRGARARNAPAGSGKRGTSSGGAAAEGAEAAGASASTAAVAAASEEGSGLPLTIGIAGAVLVAGVAGGLGLRRLLREG
jgi:hypothetical protein